MLRREMRIPHGHGQVGMTEDLLQRQDVAAVDHEVTCERVPQHMGELAFGQWQTDTVNGISER